MKTLTRCEKFLANETKSILQTHTKEHEQEKLISLGERIPYLQFGFNLGEDWSENTTYETGKRSHHIVYSESFYIECQLRLGTGDTLASAIKFVSGHPERKNFKLYSKDDPENIASHRNYYELIWTKNGECSWDKALKIEIYFDVESECRMEPTGETEPVMKLVCNGGSSDAAELLNEEVEA